MCYSAPVSFAASGVLALLGRASSKVAKKEDKYLAFIPILFSIQQFFEGIQWLYLKNGSSCLLVGYGFILFAFVIWPTYIPIAAYFMDKKRRKITKWLIVFGSIISISSLIILFFNPLNIGIMGRSIHYYFNGPFNQITKLSYLIVVTAPFLISSINPIRWFGLAILISAVISFVFFASVLISVWCFFAAILSTTFYLYLKHK